MASQFRLVQRTDPRGSPVWAVERRTRRFLWWLGWAEVVFFYARGSAKRWMASQ